MVFETIREFLCEQLACDESRVTPDTVMLEDLEMEPSDLGDLMLSLEQEFGITLFHRQSRGLILTEEGEIILLFPALFNRSIRRTRMPGSRWLKMVL